MWVAAGRAVLTWLVGDDVVKYVLSIVAGLFIWVALEANGTSLIVSAQPWGGHWMASQAGIVSNAGAPPVAVGVPIPTLAPLPMAPQTPVGRVASIIAAAMTWLGTPYLWAGCSRNGVDCSCFVQNVLRAVGISAPRTTVTQVRWARPVSRVELQPTDLIFMDNTCSGCGANPTHVGIYLGEGRMIHCGDPCQISRIDSGFYGAHFASAGRIPL
jgi:cell wall-associated NlpC family hydrolase